MVRVDHSSHSRGLNVPILMTWFEFDSCGMVRVSGAWFEFETSSMVRVNHGSFVALIMVWFKLASPYMVRVGHSTSAWFGSGTPHDMVRVWLMWHGSCFTSMVRV